MQSRILIQLHSSVNMPTKSTQITQRAQALALLEADVPLACIIQLTGLCKATIYRIRRIAKERGYNSSISTVFKDEFFIDASRPGRPKVLP